MRRVDGFFTHHLWFSDRVVFAKRRFGFVISVKAFGEYNRLGVVWGSVHRGWHFSRGEM